jgi:hypothetical protein
MGAGPGYEDPDTLFRALRIEGLRAGGIGIDVEAQRCAGTGRLDLVELVAMVAAIEPAMGLGPRHQSKHFFEGGIDRLGIV